ncbi:MAG: hypothetical protein QOG13_605 [Sphingomonadales bacterium]|jgi:hypothetical protein|nr:hypothetical protein [Sphingomonadales bacterium]
MLNRDALYINPRDFRADDDEDDAASIIRAGAYAKSFRSFIPGGTISWQRRQLVLHFPPNLDFEIATPVTIPGNVSVLMESPVVVTAASDALPSEFGEYDAWIDIGEDVAAYDFGSRWCRYDISVIRKTQSDWSSLDDLGVRLQNIQSSQIRLNRILGFARNVEFYAGAYCVAFNHVTIGDLRGAKRHLTLNAGPHVTPFDDQFVNANQFYGGEFANGGGEGVGNQQIVGVWLKGGTTTGYTSNTFFGQSYEIAALGGSGEKLPVWIEGFASGIRFLGQRTEGSTSVHMRISDPNTVNCEFEDIYYSYVSTTFSGRTAVIDDQSNGQSSIYNSLADLPRRRALIPAWDSGLIARRSNQYDGSTAYAVGGFDLAAWDFTMAAGSTSIDISGDVVRYESGRDLVRWLDTSNNKRFVIFVDTGDSAKGHVPALRPYDSGGSVLTSNPSNPYVTGAISSMFSWNAGLYSTGAYTANGVVLASFFFVRFRSEVKKAALCFRGSGALSGTPFQIKSVKIMALDSPCASWIETRAPFDNGEFIGTAAPTAGTWKRGTRVYNITPSAAGTEGWICTAAGTPGTWKTFGVIAA